MNGEWNGNGEWENPPFPIPIHMVNGNREGNVPMGDSVFFVFNPIEAGLIDVDDSTDRVWSKIKNYLKSISACLHCALQKSKHRDFRLTKDLSACAPLSVSRLS